MARSNEKSGLLGTLQDLYSKIVNEITVLRMKSYRPSASSDASSHLISQLQTFIDEEKSPSSNSVVKIPPNKLPQDSKNKTGRESRELLGKYEKPTDVSDINGLEFSKDNTADKLHRAVSDNLVQSAWDHLHASIRCARAGESEAARLHATIMNNALKEIVHYVGDEEYLQIVKNLEKEMKNNKV